MNLFLSFLVAVCLTNGVTMAVDAIRDGRLLSWFISVFSFFLAIATVVRWK